MHRIFIAVLLIMHMVHTSVIHRKDYRADRPISAYDRNCFFSPIGCHFVEGRRVMPFITTDETREEKNYPRIILHKRQRI